MNGRPFTPAEDAILLARYATTPTPVLAAELGRTQTSVFTRAYRLGLKKDLAYMREHHGSKLRIVGESGRFQPGLVPWNKGTHFASGGRSVETRFKAGNMSGAAQHNYKPIGSLRLSKDGYLERKTTDDHPVPARRWVGVHRLVWEAANGPVPAGHVVVFRAGRNSTVEAEITLDAVELVTRRELMLRNTVWRHGQEIGRLSQLRGAITRQINKRAA